MLFERQVQAGQHLFDVIRKFGIVRGEYRSYLYCKDKGQITMELSASLVKGNGEKVDMKWFITEDGMSAEQMFNAAIGDLTLLSDLANKAGLTLGKGWQAQAKNTPKDKSELDFLPAGSPLCKCGKPLYLDQFTSKAGKKMRAVKCTDYIFGSPDADNHTQKLVNDKDEYITVDRVTKEGRKLPPVVVPVPPIGETYKSWTSDLLGEQHAENEQPPF